MRNITKTIIGLLNELDTTLQQQTEEPPNASKRQIMALQKAIILWFQSRQKPAPVKVTGVFDNKTLTIYKYFEKKGSVGIDGVRRKLKQLINKNLKTPKASPDTSPAVSEKHIQYVKNKAKNILEPWALRALTPEKVKKIAALLVKYPGNIGRGLVIIELDKIQKRAKVKQ